MRDDAGEQFHRLEPVSGEHRLFRAVGACNSCSTSIVDDLDGALGQVHTGGAQVVGEIEEHEYGRFGWFIDPDGNKVELWEPPKSA